MTTYAPATPTSTPSAPPAGTMTPASWLQLLGLSALWGASYLFIAVALEGVGPAFLAFARVGGAALVLAPVLWRHRRAIAARVGRRWWRLPTIAALQIAIPFLLISAGETAIDSALAGTLVAAQPLWLVLLAPLLGLARPGWRGVAGVLLGFLGVAVLLGLFGGLTTTPNPLAAGMVVTAAGCYAIAATLVKRWLQGIDPVAITATMTAIAAALLLPVAGFDLPTHTPDGHVLVALAILAVGCTAGAFVLYNRLIATVGPGHASLVGYFSPVFAVGYGVAVLNEHLGLGTVAGLALILAGSYLSTRKPRQRSALRV